MNRFGTLFGVALFGESHGAETGIIIDGCPAGISLDTADFEADLARRRSGAPGTTPRKEYDIPVVVSGVFKGKTTGSPICILFKNANTRSEDYTAFTDIPRPGHADFVASVKYKGFSDPRGSGHFSGRITVGIVAAGVIAKKILAPAIFNTRIISVGGQADCQQAIQAALEDGDSVGAIVETRISGIPVGLGEPFFDSCEAVIAHALFSVPGVRGVEFGDGFTSAALRGSEHNDPIIDKFGHTSKNGAGGINGGITNGNEVVLRTAVKPASSIALKQQTFDFRHDKMTTLTIEGRHDACIALRSAIVIEASISIALADLSLRAQALQPRGDARENHL